jgi:hypothetical protein
MLRPITCRRVFFKLLSADCVVVLHPTSFISRNLAGDFFPCTCDEQIDRMAPSIFCRHNLVYTQVAQLFRVCCFFFLRSTVTLNFFTVSSECLTK